jgi:uncharacterized OB-fold protein
MSSNMEQATGEYLNMPVAISELDQENRAFFEYCSRGELRLQQCHHCQLKRYGPTTACPWCAQPESDWVPVEGKGTLYSYGEVHHAIQPAFRAHAPYLLLLVELDEQRNVPQEFDGLRFSGNLVDADGELASSELVRQVGIGTRLKVVFKQVGANIALPQWTIDPDAQQPDTPWRYPIE